MPVLSLVLLVANCFDPFDWRTGLHAAARDGNVARVRLFLSLRPELRDVPERCSKSQFTPLQIAVDRNQLALVEVLLAHGADVETERGTWRAPLRLATSAGRREAAELLLAHGAVLDFYSAVALDKLAEVESRLRFAAVFGAAKWLANSRVEEGCQDTPVLCVASTRGNAEMAKLLIGYGADPNAKPIRRPAFVSDNNFKGVTYGLTAVGSPAPDLDVPVPQPPAPVLSFVLLVTSAFDPFDWRTGLFPSVRDGNVARVRLLLTLYPELMDATETRPNKKRQARFPACGVTHFSDRAPWCGNLAVARRACETLPERYFEYDSVGITPAQTTEQAQRLGVWEENRIAFFMTSFTRLDNPTAARFTSFSGGPPEVGNTMLHTAAERGSAEMVAFLLARGANPNTLNADGRTPADLAESSRHTLCARLLYRYGGKRGGQVRKP